MSYVHSLIPSGQAVQFVGDSEFGSVPVLKQLDAGSWQYVLRQKGRFLVRCGQNENWQRFDALVAKAGQVVWMPDSWFTAKHSYQTTLLAVWRRREKQPWFLVTNISDKTVALRLYTRRMWIEEMFGDFKRNGI